MMWYIMFTVILALPSGIASVVPQPSKLFETPILRVILMLTRTAPFANSTGAASFDASRTTGCPAQCTRDVEVISTLYWSQKSVTATITAETLMFVVNRMYNTTKTTTITNTEVDLSDYTAVSDTNSAGTRTTSFVTTSGDALVTHTL